MGCKENVPDDIGVTRLQEGVLRRNMGLLGKKILPKVRVGYKLTHCISGERKKLFVHARGVGLRTLDFDGSSHDVLLKTYTVSKATREVARDDWLATLSKQSIPGKKIVISTCKAKAFRNEGSSWWDTQRNKSQRPVEQDEVSSTISSFLRKDLHIFRGPETSFLEQEVNNGTQDWVWKARIDGIYESVSCVFSLLEEIDRL
jgi:hypothetical protein